MEEELLEELADKGVVCINGRSFIYTKEFLAKRDPSFEGESLFWIGNYDSKILAGFNSLRELNLGKIVRKTVEDYERLIK